MLDCCWTDMVARTGIVEVTSLVENEAFGKVVPLPNQLIQMTLRNCIFDQLEYNHVILLIQNQIIHKFKIAHFKISIQHTITRLLVLWFVLRRNSWLGRRWWFIRSGVYRQIIVFYRSLESCHHNVDCPEFFPRQIPQRSELIMRIWFDWVLLLTILFDPPSMVSTIQSRFTRQRSMNAQMSHINLYNHHIFSHFTVVIVVVSRMDV